MSNLRINNLTDTDATREERADYYENKSKQLESLSNDLFTDAKKRASFYPFGQPILVGHHSENRDRRNRQRIENTFRKSADAQDKSDYYAHKSQNISNSISSNDNEAVKKLEEKIKDLKDSQETMKAINKILRAKGMDLSEKKEMIISKYPFLNNDSLHHIIDVEKNTFNLFEGYSLSNNNANIRRYEKRLKEISALQNAESFDVQIAYNSYNIHIHEDNGQIQIDFCSKPDEEVRKLIKSHGFKWSRYQKSWVRKITSNAIYSTKRLIKTISE